MPFIENDGVKIYYEVEGEGSPLVVHHGLSANMNIFRIMGYTEKLGEIYQLILQDSRGHGKSDKPYDPVAYKMKHFASDTVAILDDLGIEKAHFLGYSMGGTVGLALGVYYPDRFKSLIIGGIGMFEKDSEEEIKREQASIEGYKLGIDAMYSNLEPGLKGLSSEQVAQFKEAFYQNDPEALIAFRARAIGIIVSILYYSSVLRNANKTQQTQLETRQVQLYMDVYKSHITEENQKNTIEMLRWEWKDYDDFETKYGVGGWAKLMSYMSQLEGIGFLVMNGFLNPSHVYDLQYNSIIGLWEKYLPLTVESREKWSSPQSWDKVEFLYDEMIRIRDERGDSILDITPSQPKTPKGRQ